MNDYNFRKMRQDKLAEALGKFNFLRYPVAILLIIGLLCMTGIITQQFANNDRFELGRRFIVFPRWIETYKPEQLAYFNAGVYFERGEYETAYEALSLIEDYERADVLKNRAALRLAEQALDEGDSAAAEEYLSSIVTDGFGEEDLASYTELTGRTGA